jgi:hypothetical protein
MAERMASFCLVTGLSPADYKQLTLAETQAFYKVLEQQNEANL